MSKWTQVLGAIRVDNCDKNINFEEIFGINGYESCIGDYKDAISVMSESQTRVIPFGSEGTLTFHYWKNKDKTCMDSDTISFFGSLRDFNDDDCINLKQWLKDVVLELDKKCICVRQAVLTFNCEFSRISTITFITEDVGATGQIIQNNTKIITNDNFLEQTVIC